MDEQAARAAVDEAVRDVVLAYADNPESNRTNKDNWAAYQAALDDLIAASRQAGAAEALQQALDAEKYAGARSVLAKVRDLLRENRGILEDAGL